MLELLGFSLSTHKHTTKPKIQAHAKMVLSFLFFIDKETKVQQVNTFRLYKEYKAVPEYNKRA